MTETRVGRIIVAPGETRTISATTHTSFLSISEGGSLVAEPGKALTLTVNGVETGSRLTSTFAGDTAVGPGVYEGDVTVTVTAAELAPLFGEEFAIRQALYVDGGIVDEKSVRAALRGTVTDEGAQDLLIDSQGEAFGGVRVVGGSYTLDSPRMRFIGNGRSDFIGFGSAIVADGPSVRLTLNDADVQTTGVVRATVMIDHGAQAIIRNARLDARDGVQRDDYVFTLGHEILSVPWMLGLEGNVRPFLAMGDDSLAVLLNCELTSSNWGLFATEAATGGPEFDPAHYVQMVTINCRGRILEREGYGAYADRAIDTLLGTQLENVTYGCISVGGTITLADSSQERLREVSTRLALGLSEEEITSIPARPTVIESRRFGFMFHQYSGAQLFIQDATRVYAAETLFTAKSIDAKISVDGSRGAVLKTGNGVILQVMDTDDPVQAGGGFDLSGITGAYEDPTSPATRDGDWDTTAVHESDVVASFVDIDLTGDLYNSARSNRNLSVEFVGGSLEGAISASESRHYVPAVSAQNFAEIGRVFNTPQASVNNGVIVELGRGARWKAKGVSHLTQLHVSDEAELIASSVVIDGDSVSLQKGIVYRGAIVVNG